jgi:mRNA interferase RelE/StbE
MLLSNIMLVEYTVEALKDLKSLDKISAQRVIKKIQTYTSANTPLKHAKPLSGSLRGLYRFRVGNYRVVFSIDENGNVTVLTVLTIAHRKDVYR